MKSFISKLALGALVVTTLGGLANAAQVIVFEGPVDNWTEVSADFAVNRTLGRAWIDVQIQSTHIIGEAPPVPDVIMRPVEGLYYDSARKQVLYRTANETVVCAEDATFLWRTYLKSTGNCWLTPSTEQRKIDNGFNGYEQTVAKVVFDAQASSASQRAAAAKGTSD